MKKPQSYNDVQVDTFTPIKEGEHHLIIKQVNKTLSSTGKDMLVVLFDFAANDSQKGLITDEFKADMKPDKKWPYRGTAYIMMNDFEDANKVSKNFKAFCTCFAHSNGKEEPDWIEDDKAWCAQFKNKPIGGAFGKVHDVYEGEEKVRVQFRWFVTDSEVDVNKVPNEKMLSEKQKAEIVPDPKKKSDGDDDSDDDFMNIPDDAGDELPF